MNCNCIDDEETDLPLPGDPFTLAGSKLDYLRIEDIKKAIEDIKIHFPDISIDTDVSEAMRLASRVEPVILTISHDPMDRIVLRAAALKLPRMPFPELRPLKFEIPMKDFHIDFPAMNRAFTDTRTETERGRAAVIKSIERHVRRQKQIDRNS